MIFSYSKVTKLLLKFLTEFFTNEYAISLNYGKSETYIAGSNRKLIEFFV